MLARADNERLTRVLPRTPMGETLRRYWLPALLAREVTEPDGPPVRVRLLGEDLVATRTAACAAPTTAGSHWRTILASAAPHPQLQKA